MKVALIYGVAGQSGSYLAEELLKRSYKVVGIRRRSATASLWRLRICLANPNFELIEGDITDSTNIAQHILKYKPDVIYNAAAQSHVHTSFNQPLATWKVTAEGHINLLENVRLLSPDTQVVFFASSEMFGSNITPRPFEIGRLSRFNENEILGYQDEDTPFCPQSPYSIAKLAAFNATKLYREAYNMKCFSGIMFNKESPRRGINFVTRKITSYFHKVGKHYNPYRGGNGHIDPMVIGKLQLGNLDAYRDWSYVPDVMEGLVNLAESPLNNDYVFATGETHTIREFLDEVGKYHNLDWKEYVEINTSLFRPAEVQYLCGSAYRIKQHLGWESKVKFKELVQIMCREENGLE